MLTLKQISPCPACRNADHVIDARDSHAGTRWVMCGKCGHMGPEVPMRSGKTAAREV
jgi:Zn ribbon nucleic-acid-binding protein